MAALASSQWSSGPQLFLGMKPFIPDSSMSD